MSVANYSAKDVSTLRQMTGAGMLDCKKALDETDGDIEKAAQLLREQGKAFPSLPESHKPPSARGYGPTQK